MTSKLGIDKAIECPSSMIGKVSYSLRGFRVLGHFIITGGRRSSGAAPRSGESA